MSLVLNTNIASLNSQRSLNGAQKSLAKSMERLSSGLRINSASDDAAGLGIASRMSTQINGLNMASRNANDGISLASTTESALTEVTMNLQRIRELAVQAGNASNSAADRAAIDKEVQQRLAEIDRTAQQTSFNGQRVLDGSFGVATFQVGANVGETVSVGLNTSMRTNNLGRLADYVGASAYSSASEVGRQGLGVSSAAITSGGVQITVGTGSAVSVGPSYAGSTALGQNASSAYSKAVAINSAAIPGLTATADTTVKIAWTDTTATNQYSLSINGVSIYGASNAVITGNDFATQVNSMYNSTGVTASFDGPTGVMTLRSSSGGDISLSQTAGLAAGLGKGLGLTVATAGANNTVNAAVGQTMVTTAAGTAVAKVMTGSLHLTSGENIAVAGTDAGTLGFAAASYTIGSTGLSNQSVTTQANAATTISAVDAALSTVNTFRGTLGAMQTRFESVVASTDAFAENLTAARSRVQDTDFAAETAKMTAANVLQQAGVSVLAQANSSQQAILKLLQ